jgi:excisionase family DNA binding protein
MTDESSHKILGDPNRLVSVGDAAKLLSVSEVTIRRMLTQKKLPRRKVLRRTLILVGDLAKVVRTT